MEEVISAAPDGLTGANGSGDEVMMRCMACGVEMHEVSVVADATAPVPGYAHHTFECPHCHDTETRLLFGRKPRNAQPPQVVSQSISPPAQPEEITRSEAPTDAAADAPAEETPAPAPSAWGRALAKLRLRLDRR